MQVKLTTGRVGTGFSQGPGETISVGEAEGQRMIAAGLAEAIGGGAQQAAAAPRENAARQRPGTNR